MVIHIGAFAALVSHNFLVTRILENDTDFKIVLIVTASCAARRSSYVHSDAVS